MSTKPPSARRPRTRALFILDLVIGIVIALLGVIELLQLPLYLQFAPPHDGLNLPFQLLLALVWLVTTVVFVLFLVRGRVAFYWPIVGIVGMVVVLAILTLIAGSTT
jgi:hypothetical protein